MKKKICIIGTGGCGRDAMTCLIDQLATKGLKAKDVACFMVSDEHFNQREVMGIEVIPQSQFKPEKYDVVVAIGDPQWRKKVVESLPDETTFTTIIHPSVIMSEWVEVGEGSIIAAGSILTVNIKMGKHVHLNLKTTIAHDFRCGDYFSTAPAVNISGNCTFGECVYFGTNAAARQKTQITDNVTVGMGAVVVKNITEPGVYAGNPARKIKN